MVGTQTDDALEVSGHGVMRGLAATTATYCARPSRLPVSPARRGSARVHESPAHRARERDTRGMGARHAGGLAGCDALGDEQQADRGQEVVRLVGDDAGEQVPGEQPSQRDRQREHHQ